MFLIYFKGAFYRRFWRHIFIDSKFYNSSRLFFCFDNKTDIILTLSFPGHSHVPMFPKISRLKHHGI